ncbi:HNH endonuclease [Vibrio europaeus]|uniref:HNH endonuclease n=1 Tax=Vibrio europaeus TaxID=300876 RepID=UPI00148CAEDA|nr:HNH endonuclease [Vibrio europaeus]NOH23530.1 hypothetical protein [Vibrio europaeus]
MITVKRLKNYPYYGVSRCGKLWSFRSGKWLSQIKDEKGYLTVSLCNGLKRKGKRTVRVHRIVAQYYCDNPNKLPYINHKDEDKANNHANNLEYCTAQYNTEYSQAKTFHFLTPEGELTKVFNLKKFCRENNLNSGNLNQVALGKRKQHKGWTAA